MATVLNLINFSDTFYFNDEQHSLYSTSVESLVVIGLLVVIILVFQFLQCCKFSSYWPVGSDNFSFSVFTVLKV